MTDISANEKIIDIYSKGDYPADALSNFYPHGFTIDGVVCASMEGFLQSLKFASVKKQRKVCASSGIAAKKKGKRKFCWKLSGNVHWAGKKLSRTGEGFYALICRAYDALYADASFAAALHAAKLMQYYVRSVIASRRRSNPKVNIWKERNSLDCRGRVAPSQ